MRGLTALEREMLVLAPPSGNAHDMVGLPLTDAEDAAVDALILRGCAVAVPVIGCDDTAVADVTWVVTPRGRLALQCDAAVRAVLA